MVLQEIQINCLDQLLQFPMLFHMFSLLKRLLAKIKKDWNGTSELLELTSHRTSLKTNTCLLQSESSVQSEQRYLDTHRFYQLFQL